VGDHKLMRGTAEARRHRALADRLDIHNCASRQATRERSARSYSAARAASSRWSAQPSGAASAQSGQPEVSAVWYAIASASARTMRPGAASAAGAADPSDDRRDGLDVQAGQPACHLPVPSLELDPGGAERLGQQAEPGLSGQADPSASRSASRACGAVSNGPSTLRSPLMAPSWMVS